jgi:predicted site-specific integrase-resolvase
MAELDKLVPIDVLAEHFVVSVSTIRMWVRRGYIPKDTYLKIGNTYRFNLSKVIDALTGTHDERATKSKVDSSSQKKPSKEPEQLELDFGNPDEDA